MTTLLNDVGLKHKDWIINLFALGAQSLCRDINSCNILLIVHVSQHMLRTYEMKLNKLEADIQSKDTDGFDQERDEKIECI
ncbi:hypothetical protein SUGI_0424830 [Cryptomeria japonica]|nr:hypothetical protein SUGI_0424830 [Cryptomeria japonica]